MKLYQDAECSTVTFYSEEAKERTQDSASVQTDGVYIDDSSTQTAVGAHASTQTDEVQHSSGADVLSGFADWAAPPGIAAFLARVGPLMDEQLQASAESGAFQGYAPVTQDGADEVSLRCTLSADLSELLSRSSGKHSKQDVAQLQCTGVAWNATGSTLAVSYGRLDISGWCDTPGALACWNVFRRQLSSNSDTTTTAAAATAAAPDVLLEHSSCLMCVACHPERPAVIAAGSFNGEVLVWDTAASDDDMLLGASRIDDYCHREPIAQYAQEGANCAVRGLSHVAVL
eukprot:12003-Heterococcus_DN1.PRE.1